MMAYVSVQKSRVAPGFRFVHLVDDMALRGLLFIRRNDRTDVISVHDIEATDIPGVWSDYRPVAIPDGEFTSLYEKARGAEQQFLFGPDNYLELCETPEIMNLLETKKPLAGKAI